jgi:hypothetical protein
VQHDSNLDWWPSIELSYTSFLRAEYIAATVLVTFGVLAGRVSALQGVAIVFWEVIFATANHRISLETQINDAGGSMYIHVFGAGTWHRPVVWCGMPGVCWSTRALTLPRCIWFALAPLLPVQ